MLFGDSLHACDHDLAARRPLRAAFPLDEYDLSASNFKVDVGIRQNSHQRTNPLWDCHLSLAGHAQVLAPMEVLPIIVIPRSEVYGCRPVRDRGALYFPGMMRRRFTLARAIIGAVWLSLSLAESTEAHDCPQHNQASQSPGNSHSHSISHAHSLPLTLHPHSNSHSTPHSHFCTCKTECCVSGIPLPSIRFSTTEPALVTPTPTKSLTTVSYQPPAIAFARPPTTGPPTPQVA